MDSYYTLELNKENILEKFPDNFLCSKDARTSLGIIKCIIMMAEFINEKIDCGATYTANKMMYTTQNREDFEKVENFCDALLESNWINVLIENHLLDNYNTEKFEAGLMRAFEYNYMNLEIKPNVERIKKAAKI